MTFEERRLFHLLKRDQEKGLAYGIELYGSAVKTIVFHILADLPRTDQEECISECFLELWKSYEQWKKEKGAFKSWFYGLCRHKAMDYRRKARRQYVLPLEETIESLDNAEEIVFSHLNAMLVQQAVDELTEPERTIFIYRYYICMPVKEIAEKLELNTKKVENILCRTKPKLKKRLLELGVLI